MKDSGVTLKQLREEYVKVSDELANLLMMYLKNPEYIALEEKRKVLENLLEKEELSDNPDSEYINDVRNYLIEIDKRIDEIVNSNKKSSAVLKCTEIKEKVTESINEYYQNYIKKYTNENVNTQTIDCLARLNDGRTYSVGFHLCGYSNPIIGDANNLARSMFSSGIKSARNEGGGILEDVYMKGPAGINQINKMLEKMYEHTIIKKTGGVLVAIPNVLIDEDNNLIEIGTFPNDLNFIAKDDKRCKLLPINQFVDGLGYLPPEFILAVVSLDENEELRFDINSNYISSLPLELQKEKYNEYCKMGLSVFLNSRNYAKR